MIRTSRKRDIEQATKLIKKIGGQKVRFIALYGSTAVGTITPLSDIDMAVYYDGNKDERFIFRMKIMGRINDDFDVHIFQDLPLYIRKEIISHGKMVYHRGFNAVNLKMGYRLIDIRSPLEVVPYE
ncbi:MAG: nucleotidyltransferase domain-containing protein [Thermoplasmata archaeon]|nr:MAG: nucleotidyltransferase domain-containing protein [Thermoplasmata archaeon]